MSTIAITSWCRKHLAGRIRARNVRISRVPRNECSKLTARSITSRKHYRITCISLAGFWTIFPPLKEVGLVKSPSYRISTGYGSTGTDVILQRGLEYYTVRGTILHISQRTALPESKSSCGFKVDTHEPNFYLLCKDGFAFGVCFYPNRAFHPSSKLSFT